MVATTPTPTTSTDTGPLDWRIAITDSGGRPTPEFQRRWNTQRNNNDLIGATVNHGAPSGVPVSDGLVYIDEDTTPATEYVSVGGNWVQVSAIKFTDLQDAPHNYTSAGSKLVTVNPGATALQFSTFQSYLDAIGSARGDILYRGASGWVVLTPGTSGNVLTTHGTSADPTWTAPATGTGTVSSVSLTAPSIFSVSGSPITTSGTLALSLATQSANLVFSGPGSGSAAIPTFRSLVAADLPLATTSVFGAVKPDGTTITISGGVISSAGGGGGVTSYFGTGAPSTLHNNGDLYFDQTTRPYTAYVQDPTANTGSVSVRGSTAQATSTGSVVITFPAGTVSGDEAFIFVGGGWSVPSAPSGWTQLDNQAGSNFNGFVAHKTLSSGDVSTGSVTVTMAGTFDLFASCLVVSGTTYGGVRSTTFNRSGGSAATDSVTTGSGPITTDLAIYFGAQRASTAVTVNKGTQLQQANTGSSASGVLAASNPATGGSITATFTYPGAGQSGFYDGIVIVESAGVASPGWVNVSIPDYVEGTWTPKFDGDATSPTITYSRQSGTYTRMGNLVFCEGELVISTLSGGSGDLIITGLPITPTSPRFVGGSDVDFAIGFSPTAPSGGYVIASTSEVFLTNISGSGTTNTPVSSLTTATQIVFRVVYRV